MQVPRCDATSRAYRREGALRLAWTVLLCVSTILGSTARARGAKAEAGSSAAAQSQPIAGYRLQPGDEVAITVAPQKAYDCSGVLLPDGKLYLKNIGAIAAAGLTLDELAARVREGLSEKLVSPRISATITHLAMKSEQREGTITLSGAVGRAGALPLESGLRVRRALELAGGISATADLSRIAILHKDLTRTVVDISTAERVSDPAHNCLLQDGDALEVPNRPHVKLIILGCVARTGTQDAEPGVRLRALIDLAGGESKEADLSRIAIRRKDLTQSVVDLSGPDAVSDPVRNPVLADGDVVEIPPAPAFNTDSSPVRISGQVQNPGQFPYRGGMALDDLIIAAGKLLPVAEIRKVQIQRHGQVETIDLLERQKLGLEGKVMLQPGDEVFVPEQQNTVLVLGAVAKPGPVAFKPGQTLTELIMTGGPELMAVLDPSRVDLRGVQVLRRGQDPMKVDLTELFKKRDKPRKDVALKTGDVVFIPPHQNRQQKGPLTFLSQLGALSGLTSLFAF